MSFSFIDTGRFTKEVSASYLAGNTSSGSGFRVLSFWLVAHPEMKINNKTIIRTPKNIFIKNFILKV
jgi:hypothetical protein